MNSRLSPAPIRFVPPVGSSAVRISRLVPFAAILTAGCFATRNDVRLLQADIARRDSAATLAHRAEAERTRLDIQRRDSIYQNELRLLLTAARAHSDSLGAMSLAFWRFRGAQIATNDSVQTELFTITELLKAALGSSQRVMAAIKSMEEQRAAGGTDSASAAKGPTPAAMYQAGVDQFQKGAQQLAITIFKDFLKTYPNDDNVPRALLMLGQAYAADGKEAQADSAYAEVVEKFPKTPHAPTALLKRGVLAEAARPAEARRFYDRILTEYRQSNEAPLAAEYRKRLGG